MKKIFDAAIAALATLMLPACTQDNVHAPEPEIIIVEKETNEPAKEEFQNTFVYEGQLTSEVPSMSALMAPVTSADVLTLRDMTDKTSGYATLVLGAFDINVAAMGMCIHMGEMIIDNVQYAVYPNGNGMFFKDDFQTMAGSYDTRGSLSGTFGADGSIELVMDYKPGSMPFMCHSEFSGTCKRQ